MTDPASIPVVAHLSEARTRARIDDCWNRIGVRGDRSCPELQQHVHCRNCPVHAGASAMLLDGDVSADYRREQAAVYAVANAQATQQSQAMVVFRIGDEWLGLPAKVCSEFVEMRPIHSLPHRHKDVVLGLVSVRGELLVCVSLAKVIGIDPTPRAARADAARLHKRMIVMRHDEHSFATPADEVFGVVRFHADELRELPNTVAQATATYTRAVLPWRDHSVGYIEHDLLFYTLNRSLA